MFERPRTGERALLVHITIHQFTEQASLEEFTELASSAGAIPILQITGTRPMPDPALFVGKGKLQEILDAIKANDIEIVLFNHSLSPIQERNLEKALQCRVLDRTGLILDIFAQRARSFEGKLQVELAQLQHLSTRLIRGWTHLERQKGGIGLRGPGETQLELDRRLIAGRIKNIHKRLEKVNQQREISRRARQRAEIPVISLVGYTNAGKSTLFNRLTNANVYAANQLFATLDATLRRIDLPDKTPLILADTVGFIQQLPHDLVAAFRATLDETRLATLLLHVVDASDPERQDRISQVNQVLTDIEARHVSQILVYNKVDKLGDEQPHVERDESGRICKVWLSAVTGAGIDLLFMALSEQLHEINIQQWVCVPANNGQLRSRLYQISTVLEEEHAENGDSLLKIQLLPKTLTQLLESEKDLQVVDEPTGLPKAS
ncbi:ribosome rescue GTPase HflX [Beggiatoa leptomitoformis]|uniref:GTPase HflX n=1 Tax=Beggiatoa leptomitoformis TaxID=288004 RepID=A0A2N9YIM0_9GAMM|nr:ribosome rescue GTPase HflX [Beggiatoa leptomitoformis]ALG67695.1 GTPase HflX [Beggiatoa leptomitoformis]AUI70066.1 GTPase HflX [Beggiatoa leptomitoformis]